MKSQDKIRKDGLQHISNANLDIDMDAARGNTELNVVCDLGTKGTCQNIETTRGALKLADYVHKVDLIKKLISGNDWHIFMDINTPSWVFTAFVFLFGVLRSVSFTALNSCWFIYPPKSKISAASALSSMILQFSLATSNSIIFSLFPCLVVQLMVCKSIVLISTTRSSYYLQPLP